MKYESDRLATRRAYAIKGSQDYVLIQAYLENPFHKVIIGLVKNVLIS